MRDPLTKRSRGFGFVTFMDQAGVDKVLAQSRHELDSKTIDPKVAFPRRAQPKMVTRTKKIFVGGLSVNTTVEDVKQYFEQFGKVDDAMLMFDKTTNRHRGYPGFQATTYASRSYTGLAPGYTYQFPAIPLTAYGPMAAAAAAAAVVRGTGSTPSRTGGFLGTTSPGPMAELYGAANQDSGVSSYISAASPAPSTGFGHSLGVWGWEPKLPSPS
ncbi:MSI1 [Cervus elaphus hippelaphus]|uniref:MSI1 n=1 Tax=Cervus elaphus hippelaphus TaxID=46360 RepID=A0A212D847_CEREH|nr:MSI1 [Cervus elaphus hippelaphus]